MMFSKRYKYDLTLVKHQNLRTQDSNTEHELGLIHLYNATVFVNTLGDTLLLLMTSNMRINNTSTLHLSTCNSSTFSAKKSLPRTTTFTNT